MRGFMVAKDGTIKGHIEAEDRVAILEDVVTTGTQTLRAIEAVEAAGAEVLCVVCLVDRLAGGREKLEAAHRKFVPLLTIEDLGIDTSCSNSQ
jgi:orotate phosphoribosyltransferase